MTRILFLPDDCSILLLESHLLAGALVRAVSSGAWHPPQPFPPSPNGAHPSSAPPGWSAIQLGKMVVVLPGPHPAGGQPALISLSRRQHQVLDLMALGLNTKQIASKIHLSPRTVFLHVAALKARLKVESRAALVRKAVELGLLDINPAA